MEYPMGTYGPGTPQDFLQSAAIARTWIDTKNNKLWFADGTYWNRISN